MFSLNFYRDFLLSPYAHFLLGFFFYLLAPYFFFEIITDSYPLNLVEKFYNKEHFDFYYFADCFVIFSVFFLGLFSGQKLPSSAFEFLSFRAFSVNLNPMFWCLFICTCIYVAANHKSLFIGYKVFDIEVLGFLSTSVVLLNFILVYSSFKKISLLGFAAVSLLIAILLFSGSRNISLVVLISWLLFFSHKSELPLKVFFGLYLILIAMIVFVGMTRQGIENISMIKFLQNFFIDSFFIAANSFCTISGGRNNVLSEPSFLGAFIMAVPSFLLESKQTLALKFNLNKSGDCSPFGGAGLIGQLYANFSIYYPIYIFTTGFFYGILHKAFKKRIIFPSAVYITALPFLAFHFFNQHIYAFLKIVLFNVTIFPFFICFLSLIFREKIVKHKFFDSLIK